MRRRLGFVVVLVVVAVLHAQPAGAKTFVVNSEDDAPDASHGGRDRDMDSAAHRRGMNFTYADGEKPWLSHTPSQINTTYEAVLNTHIYLSRYVCAGD